MEGIAIAIILGLIGIFSICIWCIMLFQYLREKLKTEEKSLSKILLILEYSLLVLVIVTEFSAPYQLNSNKGLYNSYQPNLGINTSIYFWLTIIFILINITSFKFSNALFKTNIKQFIIQIIGSIVIIFIVFAVQKYFWEAYSTDEEKRNLDKLTTLFAYAFSLLLFIFNVTLFKIDRKNIKGTFIYTIIPIILFYAILLYCVIRFIYISSDEYSKYFGLLHGYG